MSSRMYGAGVAALVAATAAQAGPIAITNQSISSLAAATSGLTALDISGRVSGLTSTSSLSANFATSSYTGTLTASVYGNVATPGADLNTVVIVYEFVGHGPSGIEQFMFGQSGFTNLGLADLAVATQGSIDDLNSVGQTVDSVTIFDNSAAPANDLMVFDFSANQLGAPGRTDRFGWYIRTSGDVQIGRSTVLITNHGGTTVDMLALVDAPGQPDLSVAPVPGAAGLGLLGMALVAGRRRRRA